VQIHSHFFANEMPLFGKQVLLHYAEDLGKEFNLLAVCRAAQRLDVGDDLACHVDVHSLLLPHDDFAFAELKSEGKEQQLRLVFAMHEVLVRGHSLRGIETAMQRSELSLLTTLSGKQRSLIPDGQPVIEEITVVETDLQEKPEDEQCTHIKS
jgi:hypothetical protein